MYTFIAIVIVIASILLTISVLLQNSKGGGLAANFTSGNETFGVRKTADILEKTTWTLATVIFILCVAASAFIQTGDSSAAEPKSSTTKTLQEKPLGTTTLPTTTETTKTMTEEDLQNNQETPAETPAEAPVAE